MPSKPISRVLSRTIISLGLRLLATSCVHSNLHRVGVCLSLHCHQVMCELLPHSFILTLRRDRLRDLAQGGLFSVASHRFRRREIHNKCTLSVGFYSPSLLATTAY